MNLFQLKAWWLHRGEAKGRHGVHSPFVYSFIEEGLRAPAIHFDNAPAYISADGQRWANDLLLRRIVGHWKFSEIVVPSHDSIRIFRAQWGTQTESGRRLFDWRAVAPEKWAIFLADELLALEETDVVLLQDIHQSALNEDAWNICRKTSQVRLSIDLFGIGLLFFSKDFKERQHFALKYPA